MTNGNLFSITSLTSTNDDYVKFSSAKLLIDKSYKLYLNSSLYNTLLSFILNYQCNLKLKQPLSYILLNSTERITFRELFQLMRRDLFVFGIAVALKSNNQINLISPKRIKLENSFEYADDGAVYLNLKYPTAQIPVDNIIMLRNCILSDTDTFAPEPFHILDEIAEAEIIYTSLRSKLKTMLNLIGVLKLPNPVQAENFGYTTEDLATLQQEVKTGATLKNNAIIGVDTNSDFTILRTLDSLPNVDYLDKLLYNITGALGLPSFLLLGDYKNINYSAARAALQDFVYTSSLKQKQLLEKILLQLNIDIPVEEFFEFSIPTTVSVNEQVNLVKLLLENNLATRDEIIKMLQLGGLR